MTYEKDRSTALSTMPGRLAALFLSTAITSAAPTRPITDSTGCWTTDSRIFSGVVPQRKDSLWQKDERIRRNNDRMSLGWKKRWCRQTEKQSQDQEVRSSFKSG